MKYKFLLCVTLFASGCYGQSKQIESYLQQISAVMAYAKEVKDGYTVVRNGLNTIKNIKGSDFNLHHDFFDSLKNVNPKIKNSGKVTDISSFQAEIIKQSRSFQEQAASSGQFTKEEILYFKTVLDRLLNECAKDLDDLSFVITPGRLQMTDDERIKRIDHIYDDMQDKLTFCKSFSRQAQTLALQRLAEQSDINRIKILHQ